jgi:thiol-disulfide isomerase/thioredoxin
MKSSAALVLALLAAAIGCKSGDSPRGRTEPKPANAVAAGQRRPVFVRGPTGGAPVAPFIANELAKGRASHFGVLVYVGATWCEPCQAFHRSVAAGELDEMLTGVHMVEFDLDADRDPLEKAGYSSQLIPLFALPKPDGTASDHRIEGSIKGPDSVRQNLMPRLRAFLQGQAEG